MKVKITYEVETNFDPKNYPKDISTFEEMKKNELETGNIWEFIFLSIQDGDGTINIEEIKE